MRFVDIIGDVVTKVQGSYDPDDLVKPYYLYGHPLEIFNILAEKSQSESFKYSKYPLIALYVHYTEKVGYSHKIQNFIIAILTETKPSFSSKNRYDTTITPVLQPIYELFIEELKKSPYVWSKDYEHTKTDRLYYGKEDTFGNSGNIGNDALDAIIISDLELQINKC